MVRERRKSFFVASRKIKNTLRELDLNTEEYFADSNDEVIPNKRKKGDTLVDIATLNTNQTIDIKNTQIQCRRSLSIRLERVKVDDIVDESIPNDSFVEVQDSDSDSVVISFSSFVILNGIKFAIDYFDHNHANVKYHVLTQTENYAYLEQLRNIEKFEGKLLATGVDRHELSKRTHIPIEQIDIIQHTVVHEINGVFVEPIKVYIEIKKDTSNARGWQIYDGLVKLFEPKGIKQLAYNLIVGEPVKETNVDYIGISTRTGNVKDAMNFVSTETNEIPEEETLLLIQRPYDHMRKIMSEVVGRTPKKEAYQHDLYEKLRAKVIGNGEKLTILAMIVKFPVCIMEECQLHAFPFTYNKDRQTAIRGRITLF